MLGAVLAQAQPRGLAGGELQIVLTGNHFHREMLGEAAGDLAEHPAVRAAIAEFQGEVVAVRPRLPEGEGQ